MTRIAPSILSADFAVLAEEVARVAPQSDLLHIDVMDGHFVPNITLGAPVVKSLRRHTDLYFDCHLMIENAGNYLEDFAKAGADSCTVHIETGDTPTLLQQMRDLGLAVGLGVSPQTPFEVFAPFLGDIDMLLIMTVQPGFGGQSFMEDMMPKLALAKAEIDRRELMVKIEVDGGIDVRTAPVAAVSGADTFVAGSAVFAQPDPAAAAAAIREAINAVRKVRG